MIHDWAELQTHLHRNNLDAARQRLIQIMSSYQGYRGCAVILVFDAYKVKGSRTDRCSSRTISYVVYTKTAQTADSYIEQATHRLAKEYRVIVATSDGMEQLIAIGQGASSHLMPVSWQLEIRASACSRAWKVRLPMREQRTCRSRWPLCVNGRMSETGPCRKRGNHVAHKRNAYINFCFLMP